MSLHDLPLELIVEVVEYLVLLELRTIGAAYHYDDAPDLKPHLSQYAAISFNMQYAVEQHLLSRISLTSDELLTFEQIFLHSPRRQALLRHLTFTPILPSYDEDARRRLEQPSDQQANAEAFTASIHRLYAVIRDSTIPGHSKSLEIRIRPPASPSDCSSGMEPRHAARRYRRSYITLARPLELPISNRVTAFNMGMGNGYFPEPTRNVTPSSLIDVLRCHPAVEEVKLDLNDEEKADPHMRERLRTDLARKLLMTPCSSMKRLQFKYMFSEPRDERFVIADVRQTRDGSHHDTFGASLQQFLLAAPKLEDIELLGPICIDASVFEPPGTSPGGSRWPMLKSLYVAMSAVRPDGGWYLDEQADWARDTPHRMNYSGIVNEDSESQQSDLIDAHRDDLLVGDAHLLGFHFMPNAEFDKFLEAVTRFVIREAITSLHVLMPVSACPRTDRRPEEVSIVFKSRGEIDISTGVPCICSTLFIQAPDEWHMSDTLTELWDTKLGPDGVRRYHIW